MLKNLKHCGKWRAKSAGGMWAQFSVWWSSIVYIGNNYVSLYKKSSPFLKWITVDFEWKEEHLS